ncbi:heme oxygenase [Novosphingobium sp. PhB165]|uniref:biliverdin-producing heme oxygenase n=1 Tax=Novosphingobium sp. PhB165 TaxID=2485105 RepID=UPI00104C939B|nr:biliverdin-producing heme oxygenase [Novosphingobium sp. PhB165]TCM15684.1 heme oxygenase [Novosphingobium sp. PhB165]
MNTTTDNSLAPSLVQSLRAGTREMHERLDKAIMAADPFASLPGYARFAELQYLFHRDIAALYAHEALQYILPGLAERQRLGLIAADLADLGKALPADDMPPAFTAGEPVDVPTALGWLYVAEGSNMGAALLRKEAAKLGLSDDHGARHLAPAAEGPAAHWRAFTAGLDAARLGPDEEARAVAGAKAAFDRVRSLADARLA